MILRNWLNWGSIINSANHIYKTTGNSTNTPSSWATSPTSLDCNKYVEANTRLTLTGFGLAFGSGTTAPTINDYKLQTPITTLTSMSNSYNIGQTGVYLTDYHPEFTQTVKNDTANDITISEIALFGGNSSTCAIFTRDVITPVTIGAGETKTFVLSINLEQMATAITT